MSITVFFHKKGQRSLTNVIKLRDEIKIPISDVV